MPVFKPKAVIYQESPYCVAVDPAVLDQICSYCLYWKRCEPCHACNLTYYCSENCKNKDASDHEIECLISRRGISDSILDNEVRLVIRALARTQREQSAGVLSEVFFYKSCRSILQLETHLEELSEDELGEVQGTAQEISVLAEPFFHTTVFDAIVMLQRLRINMFQLSDHKAVAKGIACYLGISVVDHTCEDVGNFVMAFKGRDIILTAMKRFAVADMSQFRINYLEPTIPYKHRQLALRKAYYFDCKCSKCQRDSRAPESDVDDDEIFQELEDMYSGRYDNQKWLREGKKLLKKMENSAHCPRVHRRDLRAQLQLAALDMGSFEESLRHGIAALRETEILNRGEPYLVALCVAMKALGMENHAHPGHGLYDQILRWTVKLLTWTYGKDCPVINEISEPRRIPRENRLRQSRSAIWNLGIDAPVVNSPPKLASH